MATILVDGEPFAIPTASWDLFSGQEMRALEAYVSDGRPVGDFLRSFLSNDLRMALSYADDQNIRLFRELMQILTNYCPSECFGSKERYQDWLARYDEAKKRGES